MRHVISVKTAYRFLALALALVLAVGFTSHATVTEDDVSDIQSEIDEQQEAIDQTEQEIADTEARQDAIEQAKAAMESYLADLNSQYASLEEEIADLTAQIEAKEAEIEQAQADLEEAKATEEKQYEDMKARIQYMYEHPQSSFLELLLEGGSFADALNRIGYSTAISDYDREMLENYVAQKEEIEEREAALEGEKEALDELCASVVEKQEEVAALQSSTSGTISGYVSDIASAQAEIDGKSETLETQQAVLEDLIAEKKQLEAQLEAQKLAEIAASLGDVVGVQTSGTEYVQYAAYDATEEEVTALAVLIYCEAANQGYEGQLAVGSVVMNRIRDSRFSQTDIISVIRASGQFSPVTSGRYDLMLTSGLSEVTESCYTAARAAISGTSNVGNRVFFRTWSGHPELSGLIIGAHIFSYYWNFTE